MGLAFMPATDFRSRYKAMLKHKDLLPYLLYYRDIPDDCWYNSIEYAKEYGIEIPMFWERSHLGFIKWIEYIDDRIR